MHKSKLAGFIIDCRTDDLKSAATFWGAALGMPVPTLPTGQRFCVVRTGSKDFTAEANQWPAT